MIVQALGVSVAAADRERPAEISQKVDAEMIRRHAVVLGGDALEGRAPGSRGGELAAAYIAAELERYGVEPLGADGGFLQDVPLVGSVPLPTSRLALTSLGERRLLRLGDDYLLHTTGAQTWLPRPTPMVFVGYGIVAPEFDHNDYADVDVRGKVVVYLAGEPASDDDEFFAGEEPTVYAAPETKQRIALARGAVGSVLIPTDEVAGAGWERLRREFSFEHLTLAYSLPRHLSVVLHPDLAPALFSDALYDLERVRRMQSTHALRSFHLPATLSFEGEFESRDFLTPNVVGILEGSDPALADTAVVLSAHYDHLGIGPPVDGDAIYNGVVDNALGVAGVLEIARVLATRLGPPRRSVIFLLTTAEEAGNLGSTFFLDHPPLPLTRIVANINVDGLATRGIPGDVVGIGGELSDLGEMLRRAARSLGLEVSRPEALATGHEAYARSDQAAFAEAGVPAILVNEGLARAGASRTDGLRQTVEWLATVYHTPADDLAQPLDWEAARRHLSVVLALVLTVGDSLEEPRWRQGAPYAYQRMLSLADAPR